MKRRNSLITACFVLLSLSACQLPVPPIARQPSAAANVPTGTAAQGDKTLVIGMSEEPDTLNPYVSPLWVTQQILNGVMNSLLIYDRNLTLQPGLAESYVVSDDGLTYTFKLRQGVKWHDGQPFTAQDVVATWKVIMDPKSGSIDQSGWSKIVSMDTPDDHTVVMKTSEVYAPFLSFVAGTWRISPKHLIDKGVDSFKQEFGRNPIGTGPFKLVKWEAGQYMLLEKNTDYFGGSPKLDRIQIKFIPDTNTLLVQLRTGEVQMTDATAATEYEAVTQLPNNKVILTDGNSWSHIDLQNIDFLMDKRVRQALDYATPRDLIVEELLNGLATVAVGDQSPATPYLNPNLKPRPYDLDKAAELLKEAGFTKNAAGILEKGGKPLKIEHWIGNGFQQVRLVQQVVVASWRKLGVYVETTEQDPAIWATASGMFYKKAMTAGEYDWANLIDPDNMFYWHSSYIPKEPGGIGGNYPAVFNLYEKQALIDQLTADANRTIDPEKRKQVYWDIQDVLHEEVPVIFLYWSKRIYVTPKNMTGFDPNGALPLLLGSEKWDLSN